MECEFIVNSDRLATQAWKKEGLRAMRREFEKGLAEGRDKLVAELRAQGKHAVCWGYAPRASLKTPVGDLGPIRIPRIRVEGCEVRVMPKQMRRIESFNDMITEATVSGMSQRRVGGWLVRASGQSISAATVGDVIFEAAEQLQERRQSPIRPDEYAALATDGVWATYRGVGDAVLAVGVGVRWDGTFDVLDWQCGASESAAFYNDLFTRLWLRGLTDLRVLTADGSGPIKSAQEMVFSEADFQLCLWHFWRTLKQMVPDYDQRRFSRDFWELYGGLNASEAKHRAAAFRRFWRGRCAHMVKRFEQSFELTLPYLALPEAWRHRVRTVNLAEGFFRNLRRFLSRFPGLIDEEHFSRVIGLYLLVTKPDRWKADRVRLVA
jgi:transposase-like protein